MPRLSWKFTLLTLVSCGLGLREWQLAWILLYQQNLLTDYVTELGLRVAAFEVIFLTFGGLFLISWPIAYRKLQWRNSEK